MKIFVLIDVSYDYYEFRENIHASTSLDDLREMARTDHASLVLYENEVPVSVTESKKSHLEIEEY